MQIYKMTIDDAAELATVDKLCFAVPWSEQSFREEAENSVARYFVAREDNKIIGYGGVWLVQGEGQISNIAVLPEYRRGKVASKILEKIIEECAEAEQIVLEVRESNNGAIALYEGFGFEACGIRKNFYHSPIESAVVMVKKTEA